MPLSAAAERLQEIRSRAIAYRRGVGEAALSCCYPRSTGRQAESPGVPLLLVEVLAPRAQRRPTARAELLGELPQRRLSLSALLGGHAPPPSEARRPRDRALDSIRIPQRCTEARAVPAPHPPDLARRPSRGLARALLRGRLIAATCAHTTTRAQCADRPSPPGARCIRRSVSGHRSPSQLSSYRARYPRWMALPHDVRQRTRTWHGVLADRRGLAAHHR
jgi:hypothetical protein